MSATTSDEMINGSECATEVVTADGLTIWLCCNGPHQGPADAGKRATGYSI